MVVIDETKFSISSSSASINMANLLNNSAKNDTTNCSGTATTTATENKPIFPRLYNKIVLTLENSLIPEAKLEQTPSHLDGLDAETEKDLRILGCELIQTAGILLKLPQVAMATGQVIFQRFFYSKSFVRHNMETVAMSCVCLASKIEEAPRRIRDVINVFHHIKQVRAQKDITPMILDTYYTNLKTQVIKAERRVLKELGFCVHVKHPHKLIVMYLQVLKYEKHEQLMQMSWNFMNDSLRTDVFMRYNPETIACACIYLSARKLSIPLPSHPHPWYGIFQVPEDDIIDICYRVMELYTRGKPNVEKLEEAVEELKKRYMESRNKTKEQNTPPAVTAVDRSNGSHNAWGGFIQRTIPLPLPNEKSPSKDSRSRSRSRSRDSRRTARSRSRSRTRSRSNSMNRYKKSRRDRERERGRERSRSRTPPPSTKNKKKSRHYSRSPSSSPHSKHRKRKPSRDRHTDKYMDNRRDKYQDKYQDKRPLHHHHASSSSSNSNKHHRGYTSSHRGSHRDNSHDSRHRKR
ncbi:cyclin-L1 [Cochliomyia hominivorax]